MKLIILAGAFFALLFAYVASIYDTGNASRQMKNIQRLKMSEQEINAKVVIYTKPTCGYCIRAKHFLKEMHVKYDEVDVLSDTALHQTLMEKTGSKTVPLIFINDVYIGGCTDMLDMAEDGRLEKLLIK